MFIRTIYQHMTNVSNDCIYGSKLSHLKSHPSFLIFCFDICCMTIHIQEKWRHKRFKKNNLLFLSKIVEEIFFLKYRFRTNIKSTPHPLFVFLDREECIFSNYLILTEPVVSAYYGLLLGSAQQLPGDTVWKSFIKMSPICWVLLQAGISQFVGSSFRQSWVL